MLTFREISISDRPWIQAALQKSDFMGCEYCFGNNLAWHRAANSKIASFEDFYLICAFDTEDGAPHFSFPSGSGSYRRVISAMAEYAEALQKPLVITGLTEQTLPILQQAFPDAFAYAAARDSADYIYLTADFMHYSGKKFHKKRNHVSQFSQYHATFSEITPNDFDECIAFAAQAYNDKSGYTDTSSVIEQLAIHTYFSHFSELELCGGLLRAAGKLVAFSVGEPLNHDTFDVHIEKADIQYHGAFPAMAQLFAAHFAKDYLYLNREEDLGIAGLRKSKLSYQPVKLLEKWVAVCKTPTKLCR